MKIILFGSSGMLGNYVYKVLSKKYNVICVNRKEFDIETCDWNKLNGLMNILENDDVIVNCAGIIPQRKPNSRSYIKVNTLFPHKLEEISKIHKCKFIHITTDCVFAGKKGNHIETDQHDSEELYGITKSIGEPTDSCVIRTSIIGEEQFTKKSLLEWVRANKNGVINGYSNFYWNGVTCLTLANIIENIVRTNNFWKGVRHIHSPNTVTKYELCNIINRVYNLNITINPVHCDEAKNMTVASIYPNNYSIGTIEEQIEELKNA
jgi:dTDP-4-dehydrorhamnose reductase